MRRSIAGILTQGEPRFLGARTARTLTALGVEAIEIADAETFRAAIERGVRWFVRAGGFPACVPVDLPASQTGRPVAGWGAPLSCPHPSLENGSLVRHAEALLHATGGDLDAHDADLPFAALQLCERLAALPFDIDPSPPLHDGIVRALLRMNARIVRISALDAHHDDGPRVAEVITSLQIGGAEAIARTLAAELPRAGVAAKLFALGSPTRTRMPVLDGEVDLGATRLDAGRRVARLVSELIAWGTDLAHTHLFGPDVNDALARAGFVPMVTIHNARQGFPRGTEALSKANASLVVACASAVARDLLEAGVSASIRTVPNGIGRTDPGETRPALERASERVAATRREWGVEKGAAAVLIVANPRPQKRLERVAPIAESLVALGRKVHVVWAGAASSRDEGAQRLAGELVGTLAASNVPLTHLGAIPDLAHVYAACDVLLTTSDWEGLSLAQLEALAARLPVVATEVGGASELARASSSGWVTVIASDAGPDSFARALDAAVAFGAAQRGSLDVSPPALSPLPDRFTTHSMVRGYARLVRRTIAMAGRRGFAPTEDSPLDLVLVTNNFSPGGAQSSARRLLVELARRGRKVLAITLEEDDSNPTPGFAALRAAGVEVLACPRTEAELAVRRAIERIDRTGARSLVFWNAIAEHKILFAEQLHDVRLFDVSPGEMYFDSLARYFARPRPDAAGSAREYGSLLEGAIVKFEDERERASDVLCCAVSVVSNGVPLVDPLPVRRAGKRFRFGTSVRIHEHKRLDLLLEAFRQLVASLAPVELAILGTADAGQQAHLESLVDRSRDLPVEWLGFSDDVAPFLAGLDAFVLVAEPMGCPNASLEALGAGLPTIATDVGGIREQLEGGAGLVVPRLDPAALAEAMMKVATDEPFRNELAQRGHDRARERFSVERMADDYERLFFDRA